MSDDACALPLTDVCVLGVLAVALTAALPCTDDDACCAATSEGATARAKLTMVFLMVPPKKWIQYYSGLPAVGVTVSQADLPPNSSSAATTPPGMRHSFPLMRKA